MKRMNVQINSSTSGILRIKLNLYLEFVSSPSMKLIITGTPGVGKEKVAKELEKLGFKRVDVEKLIKKEKLAIGYDKVRKTKIVGIARLKENLESKLRKAKKVVVDSHLAHHISPKLIDLCVVLRCNPRILRRRLEERGFDEGKIKENLEAEALAVCASEAWAFGHRLHEIDATQKNPKEMAREIVEVLEGKKKVTSGWIDWSKEFFVKERWKTS
jgi:adenylate kinase